MTSVSLDPLRFVVEHRDPDTGGGPTLRVHAQGLAQRELLRFDCFERNPHWHLDPAGRDEVGAIPAEPDSIDWVLARLRGDLAGQLARADFQLEAAPHSEHLERALQRVERAMRNPPLDLDAIRPEMRRPSLGEKWSTYPADVLPLWVADMDFPVAEPIRRVLRTAVACSDLGYPIHPAPTDVPAIAAARMEERFGWRPEPSRVEILTDVVQGIYVAIQQFSRPGEGVLVQTPIYAPFLRSVRDTKRTLIESPLSLGAQGYRVDAAGLRAAAARGARILLLCSPHNPSGRVFRAAELESIAEIAIEHDLLVVSDEIHADLAYSGHSHIPFASLAPEVEARTITLTAASKAFNVAGLRCALAIFGSSALKRRFCELPRHIRGGIGVLGIEALRAAWRHGQPWLDEVLAYLEANRDHLERFVRESLPGVGFHAPEATYLAWLDFRSVGVGSSPSKFFLEHAKVALTDGAHFGAPGEGFLRINFATSRNILCEALERMRKAFAEAR